MISAPKTGQSNHLPTIKETTFIVHVAQSSHVQRVWAHALFLCAVSHCIARVVKAEGITDHQMRGLHARHLTDRCALWLAYPPVVHQFEILYRLF
jgi:hypothetical protein